MYNELKKRAGFSEYKSGAGFTLLELLITVAIISIVTTAIVLVINPVETLSQARDGRRISEVTSIDEAITLALQQSPALFEGDPNTIYLSLPDTSPTCASYTLPPLVSPWKYNCVTLANLLKADGNGWIPMNFTGLSIVPFTSLPVDPVNEAVKKGLYYNYVPGWEIDAQLESHKFEWGGADDRESLDGGNTVVLYEKGENLNAAPKEVNARITYEIKDGCSVDFLAVSNFWEFYPRWTIPTTGSGPVPSSKRVVVTKLMFYSPSNTFSSGEQVEMAIYNNGTPNYDKISDVAVMIGTGAAGWVSSTLSNPVPLTLGNSYIFGMLGEAVGGGLSSFDVAQDRVPICSEHSTVPNPGFWTGNDGILDPSVPTAGLLTYPTGFSGISYAPN